MTGAAGQVIFESSQRGTIATLGGTAELSSGFTLPAGLADGEYTIQVIAWNGYPSVLGSNWKSLAAPVTATFSVG